MSMPSETKALYAAVHAAEFPAQSLLRLRPDLRSKPVVVMDGVAPQETVCAMNTHARTRGATLGMTRMEAEELDGFCVLSRSGECECAAREVFLECLSQFSPRIEEAWESSSARTFVLDIKGTERLFGPPLKLAERLREALQTAGLQASIAVSSNYHAARMRAGSTRGISIIADGNEAAALEKLPISHLHLTDDQYETFSMWGIRALGEVANLPEVDLIIRLGQESKKWRELALGQAEHTFRPIEAKFELKEFVEFETHVEQIDSLLFIGANMIDCLVARASARAMSLASLTVRLELEPDRIYERVIRPAIPSIDRKFLLKLLQLEIAAHPPQAPVVSMRLSAEAGQSNKVQLGLFAPQVPEPSRLDVTLARLKALVGDDRVGSPVLEDSHRPGSFRMSKFEAQNKAAQVQHSTPRMAVRRMRPPVPVRVDLHAMRPLLFQDGRNRYEVIEAFGPWKTSGCWWTVDGWDTEEWDVLATTSSGESVGCVLVLDCVKQHWQLEAMYD